ncbi:MAG: tRNA guanosine(34) transglycosylase Tgt [Rhodobiaceae bacterium]|nr:tRNA guanosine(34) transglycosylase Tgt [Rhodobiaceae bacterium]OUT94443.1 MAG: tRNA guanosine(34) transglycosylase Tgt [Rhizobiales bacterium TMED29]
MPVKYELLKTDGMARVGRIETPRGAIRTPAFMPVGTAGTVKAMYPSQVRELGADIVLGNTYHLMLRPGAEEVAALGGLQSFMQWDGPVLTDSGGFQVMSLAKLAKMSEDGVRFQSHIDGSEHMLTPERSIEIQTLLGANIRMVLDECTSFPATHEVAQTSMHLSTRWAARSKTAFEKYDAGKGDALFGIVQGGVYEDLRHESAGALIDIGFDGYAVGGLAVGEGHEEMLRVLNFTVPVLPADAPRYLMGVGTPHDLVQAVARGIDMFDCVMPTRAGRHGLAYTRRGKVNLRNARHANDARSLDDESACPAASQYSRAYLHHLFKCNEYLGPMLLSWNNLHYYQQLMGGLRAAIEAGKMSEFIESFERQQAAGDLSPLD